MRAQLAQREARRVSHRIQSRRTLVGRSRLLHAPERLGRVAGEQAAVYCNTAGAAAVHASKLVERIGVALLQAQHPPEAEPRLGVPRIDARDRLKSVSARPSPVRVEPTVSVMPTGGVADLSNACT